MPYFSYMCFICQSDQKIRAAIDIELQRREDEGSRPDYRRLARISGYRKSTLQRYASRCMHRRLRIERHNSKLVQRISRVIVQWPPAIPNGSPTYTLVGKDDLQGRPIPASGLRETDVVIAVEHQTGPKRRLLAADLLKPAPENN